MSLTHKQRNNGHTAKFNVSNSDFLDKSPEV